MFNRGMHSAGRIVRGLIGAGIFVQASQHVSTAGLLAMALGAVLIITAGADVAPRPRETPGSA